MKHFYNFLKTKKSKLYILFGLINTFFAYFSSVFIYIILKNYVLDVLIFTFVSLINITFSYFTMGIYVFKNKKLGLTKYLKYLSSSFFNVLLGITISTILIRVGINIYLTQVITIACNILIQLLINIIVLNKKS